MNKLGIRYTEDQKSKFINFIISKFREEGINLKEVSQNGNRNVVSDNIDSAKIILTAHYDTPRRFSIGDQIIHKNMNMFRIIFIVALILIADILIVPLINLILKMLEKNIIVPIIAIIFISIGIDYLFKYLVSLYYKRNKRKDKLNPNQQKYAYKNCKKANENNYNDNTSGILCLIEVAKKLNIINEEKKIDSVGFVFFDNEEKGLKGSRSFVKSYHDLESEIIINIDCIATEGDYDTISYIIGNNKNKEKTKVLVDIIKSLKNKSDEIKVKRVIKIFLKNYIVRVCYLFLCNSVTSSDHLSFTNYNALSISRKKFNLRRGNYIPNIHTNEDTKENSDPDNISRISCMILSIIREII
ncbi:M28 family peptidase [Clostridioides difficile]|nr:M28 family peptidase [Clostridioides difficile]HBG1882311.1 M28 family peptidase [Clostridioides difficile]